MEDIMRLAMSEAMLSQVWQRHRHDLSSLPQHARKIERRRQTKWAAFVPEKFTIRSPTCEKPAAKRGANGEDETR